MSLHRSSLPMLLFVIASAVARDGLAGSADPIASAAPSSAPTALAELPKLAPIPNPEADPAALKELDALLERLTSQDEHVRTTARAAIGEVTPSIIAAIKHRVQDLRSSLDRDAAPHMLDDARKAGRKALRAKGDDKPPEKKKKSKDKDEADSDDGDWLDFVLAQPKPRDKTWQDLVKLLALERMLTAVGTTPAVRELIQLHAYFGDMLRVDLQRQIGKLRDKAVPALIEARQHDAKLVQRWANKQLDMLGKSIPGEAVGTSDTVVLADVLRAYGRTRDVDAERVILSFTNADRVQLRDAAREAIAAIGEPGIWQLRDQYLGLTGSKPPKDWAWDRIARELFGVYDHQRMAELHKLMDDGLAAVSAKKVAEATDDFDKVLARSPLFDRRREMVPAYFDRAKEIEGQNREGAIDMLRKALRLDPKGDKVKPIQAEVSYLEGLASIDRGAPDRFLFERAIELVPGHEGATRALASLEEKAVERQQSMKRYVAAVVVGVLAIVAMLLLGRRKSAPPPAPKPTDAPTEAPPSALPPA